MNAAADVRWGIVGPGRIAEKVVQDFPLVDGARAVAVASRSARARGGLRRRARPGARVRLLRARSSPTPISTSSTSRPRIRSTTRSRSPPSRRARRCWSRRPSPPPSPARRRSPTRPGDGVFVMEAMWTRFQPAIVAARRARRGRRDRRGPSVQADLGVARAYDAADRLFDPALGGGALLDLGVYVVSFAQTARGAGPVGSWFAVPPGWTPRSGCSSTTATGGRPSARLAAERPPGAARFGTTGWIDVLPRFHHPEPIVLTARARARGDHPAAPGRRLRARVIEVTECLRAGRTESAGDAAGRHPRRPTHPRRGRRAAGGPAPRGRHGRRDLSCGRGSSPPPLRGNWAQLPDFGPKRTRLGLLSVVRRVKWRLARLLSCGGVLSNPASLTGAGGLRGVARTSSGERGAGAESQSSSGPRRRSL